LEIGLVNQLAPAEALLADALELAGKLAERPPIAVSWVLKAMAAGAYEGIDAGLKAEADGSAAVRETRDKAEGSRPSWKSGSRCSPGNNFQRQTRAAKERTMTIDWKTVSREPREFAFEYTGRT